MKPALSAVLIGLVSTCVVAVGPTPAEAAPRKFANCTAMNKVYKHGVGKFGAHDKTSGVPVTNFKRNNALYLANKGRDRDGDRIACEKR